MLVAENPATEIGAKIRQARKSAKLTQSQLAKAVGVSQAALSSWEKGLFRVPYEAMVKIAVALGADLQSFTAGAEDVEDIEQPERPHQSTGMVLKTLRQASGLTQSEVAASLGVPQTTVSVWESGLSEPSLSQAAQMAKLYGVTLDSLIR